MNKFLKEIFIFTLFFSFRKSFNFIESESLLIYFLSDSFETKREFKFEFKDSFE